MSDNPAGEHPPPLPPNESPNLPATEIPGKPTVEVQVTRRQGVTLIVTYPTPPVIRKLEVFYNEQKVTDPAPPFYKKITDVFSVNPSPITICFRNINRHCRHHFIVRGVTQIGISGPFSDPVIALY